jgi:hypothetical protein
MLPEFKCFLCNTCIAETSPPHNTVGLLLKLILLASCDLQRSQLQCNFSVHEATLSCRDIMILQLRRVRKGRQITRTAPSFHLLQQPPRLTQQVPNLLALGDRIPSEQAVPARVLVSLWSAGARRTAVHATAPFAAHRRRAARSAAADFGAATRTPQHRAAIGGVIAQACVPRSASPSETITLACWVTLPTMALPPSRTDTFCTVMAVSPRLR